MKRSIEDIEVMKRKIMHSVEASMNFYDALLEYQVDVYEPMVKKPFCFRCGKPIERERTGPWKCEECQREERLEKIMSVKLRQSQPPNGS